MARRGAAIAAAAALALAAGCGGGGGERLSKEEYQRELASARGELEDAFAGLEKALQAAGAGSGSLEKAAGEVENIQEELKEAADDLDGVAPPENVEEAHDELVEGMRALSEDMETFREAIEDGDTAAIHEFAASAGELESVRDLEAATDELRAEGYEFGAE